ncbi:MAG: hypothetical protein ACR2F6_02295 [Mycobacteriales bacterium]
MIFLPRGETSAATRQRMLMLFIPRPDDTGCRFRRDFIGTTLAHRR